MSRTRMFRKFDLILFGPLFAIILIAAVACYSVFINPVMDMTGFLIIIMISLGVMFTTLYAFLGSIEGRMSGR